MYLKLTIADGSGYISTMLDEKTSLVCKPVSSDEVSKMAEDYSNDEKFEVGVIKGDKGEVNFIVSAVAAQKDALKESYLEMNKLRIKEKEEKFSLEFSRYKQDCRKRALDLAHAQVTSPKWQQFIQNEDFAIKNEKEEKTVIVQDELLISMADKYYNWLITIPEK